MAPAKKIVFKTKHELAVELAKYTANLSSKFCKERGIFTVVLSGGDLISWLWYNKYKTIFITLLIQVSLYLIHPTGNCWNLLMLIQLNGLSGTFFGSMRGFVVGMMPIATINSHTTVFSPRYIYNYQAVYLNTVSFVTNTIKYFLWMLKLI